MNIHFVKKQTQEKNNRHMINVDTIRHFSKEVENFILKSDNRVFARTDIDNNNGKNYSMNLFVK